MTAHVPRQPHEVDVVVRRLEKLMLDIQLESRRAEVERSKDRVAHRSMRTALASMAEMLGHMRDGMGRLNKRLDALDVERGPK